jgi:hypothetical protein
MDFLAFPQSRIITIFFKKTAILHYDMACCNRKRTCHPVPPLTFTYFAPRRLASKSSAVCSCRIHRTASSFFDTSTRVSRSFFFQSGTVVELPKRFSLATPGAESIDFTFDIPVPHHLCVNIQQIFWHFRQSRQDDVPSPVYSAIGLKSVVVL